MADNTSYTIYLKSVGVGDSNSQKPTTPKVNQPKPTEPEEEENVTFMAGFTNFATKTKKFAGGIAGGIKGAAKSFLPVAIMVAAITVADKAASFLIPFYTTATGDYSFQNNYSNFKQTLNNAFNPIQYFINAQKMQHENYIFNRKVSEQRLLLGDSTINYNFGRGINV
jgi:hypothetical protein